MQTRKTITALPRLLLLCREGAGIVRSVAWPALRLEVLQSIPTHGNDRDGR